MADLAQLGITIDSRGVDRGEAALGRFERRAQSTERATDRFGRGATGTFGRVSAAATTVRQRILSLQTALAGLGVAFVARHILREFAQFEQGLVQVGKTTGIEGARLEGLGVRVQEIGREVPVATTRLLELASAAGQLGVKGVDNIAAFTETLGKMELATDVAGEEGARSLARLLTITGESLSEVDRLGSAIVDLGNNMATTEQEIVQTSTFLAASTSAFDLNARTVAGLSAAMRALGQRAETSGSAVGAAFTEISTALAEGGEGMRTLMDLTGRTADELRTTFRDNATAVFVEFTEALGQLPAAEQTRVLDQFNLAGRETARVIGAAASNIDVLRDALNLSERGWENNTALTEEALVAAESFTAQMQLTGNQLNEVAVAIGRELAPVIVDLTEDFREFIEEAQRTGQIKAFAEDLGAAFSTVASNLDLVVTATGAFLGLRLGAAFGPIGAAVGLAGGALAGYALSADDATEASNQLQRATESLNTSEDRAAQSAEKLTRARLEQAQAALKAARANALAQEASGEFGFIGSDSPAARQVAGLEAQIARSQRALTRRSGRVTDTGFVPEAFRGGQTRDGDEDDETPPPGGDSDAAQKVLERLRFQEEQLQRTSREQAIYNELQQAGVSRASEYGQQIEAATGRMFDAQRQQEELNQRLQFFGDIASGAFSDLVSGAADLETVMERVIRSFADAAIQATLLGQGPLAGLFGTRSATQGGVGGILGALFHEGGVVGSTPVPHRLVPASMFANAPHFQSGGEVPAILHQGEEVLTRDDPRHRRNMGAMNVHVTVGVDVDESGNLTPFVTNVSRSVVAQDGASVAISAVQDAQSRRVEGFE